MSTQTTDALPISAPQSTTHIEVLLIPTNDGGYRVFSGTLGLALEAPSKDAVVHKLQDWIRDNWVPGAELLKVELSPVEHPLARFAGIMRGDPMLEEWKKAVQDYRKMVDEKEHLEYGHDEGIKTE